MEKILKKQAHLNRVLKAVLNTNQLIVKERDPAGLIQKACEELIGTMGYFNAWIGLLDEEGRHVKLTGAAGFDRGFDVMRERLNQGVFPSCMQRTLQTNESVVITAPIVECADCPLSKEYAGRFLFTCRLEHEGRIWGILSVSVPAGFEHEKDEHDLVLEVSRDLAFALALAKINTEKRNQALLDHSPVCHKIVDLDFNLQYMNANGFKMLNLEPNAGVYGKPYPFDFFPEPFKEKMIKSLTHVKRTGETVTMEALTRDIQGNDVWLNSSLIPVFSDDNTMDYITVVSDNTTRQKQDEKQRIQLETRLRQAQKMEAIGTIAGGIAHDFNNILFSIIGMSELLMEDLSKDSIEYENALEILTAGKRGADLVNQILAFSRQSEHQMSPTRIQTVLEEVLKLTRSTIPSYIEINHDIKTDCAMVMADPTQIHQIAMNIITNAYHAMETADGKISVVLRETELALSDLPSKHIEPGTYALLSFSDTGSGIPPELRDKIFDPYFTTKEKGKGTGLGLSIVYSIVKAHKGDITVYSEIGKGTTFNIYLPVIRRTGISDLKNSIEKIPTGNERILLVDDEEPIAKLEKQMLERIGYSVTRQTSPLEALICFKENPHAFDLILSDMNMPRMTGLQLAKEIKSIRNDIPIIISTGFSDRLEDQDIGGVGIDAVLMKPVIKSDMAQTIRKVLEDVTG
ncbi:hybrid sensor histidine kinase/response regulator [Desulfobacter latus]|uniref:histidine kinase n=1 Tax=Desulfobacter latus TaxID=2292 RepID=A0A850SZL6_9BACT|nr:ATP-binding protein [Desulfobacter latus]NWH05560.1 response regulator [Desulfobacter latus]